MHACRHAHMHTCMNEMTKGINKKRKEEDQKDKKGQNQ
jgi:hypothetical protein